MNFETTPVEKLIEIYTNSKEEYYTTGKSKLKDSEFDELEEFLTSNDYIDKYVGSENIPGTKTPHLSPMLSLDKVQVFTMDFTQDHAQGIVSALSRYSPVLLDGNTMLRFTDKVDGLACNITYIDGELKMMATRGNGSIGTDITEKCKFLVPIKLSKNFSGEVRGEIFVKKSTFLEKYAEDYKNPRNLAAGIVGVSDLKDVRIKDLNILLFEIKGNIKTLNEVSELVPLIMPSSMIESVYEAVCSTYYDMLNRRASLDYPSDGIVVRIASVTEHRDNGLAPLYAVAVKFPPMLATTKIKLINWNLRKTGKYIPHATLEPVELDGTIVTHAALHNWNWVNSRGCFPGATVVIGKNGDIIPQIQSVTHTAPESGLPESFTISENGIHMLPTGDVSEITGKAKFIAGMLTLGFFGFGGATFIKLYDLLSGDIENIFDNSLFTKDNLLPIFGSGKTGPEFMKQRNKILGSGITISQILLMLQFDHCGNRHSKALWKVFNSIINDIEFELDQSGLNRAVIEDVTVTNRARVLRSISLYQSNGYDLITPAEKVITEGDITFEMTGSPKMAGYKSKEAFVAFVSTWTHTKLGKDTTYLVTDDKVSKTSKMKTADKNGTTVLTYEEATDIFRNSL